MTFALRVRARSFQSEVAIFAEDISFGARVEFTLRCFEGVFRLSRGGDQMMHILSGLPLIIPEVRTLNFESHSRPEISDVVVHGGSTGA